jgi:hypothetical protein
MPEAVGHNPELDASLMSSNLRQEKKEAESGENKDSGEEEGGRIKEWRERIMQARRALDVKQKLKDKMEEKAAAPAQAATNRLLRWAWLNIISSFGLTLIYINIHVFLGKALGNNFFCKLGDEWKSKVLEAGGQDTAEAFSAPGKMIGIAERMGLLFLNLAAFLIVMLILSFFVLIISFGMASIKEKIAITWKAVAALGFGGLKVLSDLFKGLF